MALTFPLPSSDADPSIKPALDTLIFRITGDKLVVEKQYGAGKPSIIFQKTLQFSDEKPTINLEGFKDD